MNRAGHIVRAVATAIVLGVMFVIALASLASAAPPRDVWPADVYYAHVDVAYDVPGLDPCAKASCSHADRHGCSMNPGGSGCCQTSATQPAPLLIATIGVTAADWLPSTSDAIAGFDPQVGRRPPRIVI
ncbi:MAG: hypothetical protein HY834_13050 [Devosia nanyangense]|uniref:DUF3551 domain-containing protein n=1 Tax=Devosia nanyangense TaxID=1228055 RepID=A0A933L3U5_9HYPH|nr:hypothetical protein [Devosia nanyangense]